MRRFIYVLLTLAMFVPLSVVSAENDVKNGMVLFADRQSSDIRVVMYMTSW